MLIFCGIIPGNPLNIAGDAAAEPFYDPYALSKSGAVGLTRGLEQQFASCGIVINGIRCQSV